MLGTLLLLPGSANPTLVLLCSTHVDDLKICGTPECTRMLLSGLSSEFGTLKVQVRKFEHCGIYHVQNDNFEVLTHQNHYCQNLIPISMLEVCADKPDTPLTPAQHAQYLSLLGGVAWLNQTRCVYILAGSAKGGG